MPISICHCRCSATTISCICRSEADMSCQISVVIPTFNRCTLLRQCLDSLERQTLDHSAFEVIVVVDGSTDGTADWLEEFQSAHSNVRVFHCDHVIGDAAGKNIGLKQSRGKHIVIMDASTEVVGDLLTPVQQRLADDSVGIFGPYGLSTDDMRHFHASQMYANGLQLKDLQQRMGHSSVSVTADIYTHVDIGMQKAALEAFEESMSDA